VSTQPRNLPLGELFYRGYRPSGISQISTLGRCVRVKNFANFTQEVQDFPTLSVSIHTAVSGPWLEQLSGITHGGVFVPTGVDPNSRIRVNEIVGSGIYREDACEVTFTEPVCGPFVAIQGLVVGNVVYGNPYEVVFQGPSAVELGDTQALVKEMLLRKSALTAQLNKLKSLSPGWDGQTAPCISRETIESAKQIIGAIVSQSLSHLSTPRARIGPLPDGTARFELTHGDKELFLTVNNNSVEVQKWQPLDTIDSHGFWETDATGVKEYLAWLLD
jgi:hypothetical protein